MQSSNFFVESLGEHGDADGPSLFGGPKGDLSEDLIRKGSRHDERRVTGSTAKIDKSTFSKKDNMVPIGEQETVNLGLNINDALGIRLKPSNVNFNIKVTDIADDSVILHLDEVFAGNDITTTRCRDENVALVSSLFHGQDFVAFESGLESVDGIDFGDEDASTHSAKGTGTALSDVSVACDNADFTTDHDIRSTLDTINQGLTTSIYVLGARNLKAIYKDYRI